MRQGMLFRNPDLINAGSRKGRAALIGAIQGNWDAALTVQRILKNVGIQEFTNSENFPTDALTVIEKYHIDITELDVAYESAFHVLDLTKTKTSNFTVRDVETGLTFARVRDGMAAKVYAVEGAQTTVTLDLYGAGLDWMRTWFDDGEWWTISDNALEFRRKWFEAKATIMYALIEALTDSTTYNVDYDATGGATQIELDIKTINTAVVELITANLQTGLGVTAGTPLVMLVPLSMKGRVERAMAGRASSDNTGGLVVNYNITPFYTSGITTADTWADAGGTSASAVPLGYLCIPGRKNKIGNRMNLTLMAETDILKFAETVAGWGRYGAFLNMVQWMRVLSSA